ncbi:MAG: transglutaminase domain-containing protein [Thioalkalivibrionaceae bacterium]
MTRVHAGAVPGRSDDGLSRGEHLGQPLRFRVRHRTVYRYAVPTLRVLGLIRLKPRPAPGQTLAAFQMRLAPGGGRLEEHVDAFGNPCALCEWSQPQVELVLDVAFDLLRWRGDDSLIASTPLAEFPGLLDRVWATSGGGLAVRGRSPVVDEAAEDRLDAMLYAVETGRMGEGQAVLAALGLDDLALTACGRLGGASQAFAGPSAREQWTVQMLADVLATRIPEHFAYVPGATTVETSIDELLHSRAGVCQDFAHLAVAAARAAGVPARYVSGYIETQPPPGQERLRGVDATHAWASLYDPALGWIDIDPTNAARCDERHLTLAWGRGYPDVAPVSGVFQGGMPAGLEVSVDVERLRETMRA